MKIKCLWNSGVVFKISVSFADCANTICPRFQSSILITKPKTKRKHIYVWYLLPNFCNQPCLIICYYTFLCNVHISILYNMSFKSNTLQIYVLSMDVTCMVFFHFMCIGPGCTSIDFLSNPWRCAWNVRKTSRSSIWRFAVFIE